MKTNKSELIRVAIRAAGEPVTVDYLVSVTGIPRYNIKPLITRLIHVNEVFVAGTKGVKQKPGSGQRNRLHTYELSEFAGEC